jgi:hypothetical protein
MTLPRFLGGPITYPAPYGSHIPARLARTGYNCLRSPDMRRVWPMPLDAVMTILGGKRINLTASMTPTERLHR